MKTQQARFIYIPSKGRGSNCLTANLLSREHLPFKIVVEPIDFDAYRAIYDETTILKLPKDNMGIAYARNWIKQYSKENGESFHWQIDDDIKKFMIRNNGKNVISTAEHCLGLIEREVSKYSNVGAAAPIYSTFAFSKTTDHSYNGQVCSCVYLNNETSAEWRDETIDDTDYSMQMLADNHWVTILFNRLLIDTVPTLAQSGGLTDIHYRRNIFAQRQNRLCELWKGCFKMNYKGGRSRILPSSVWRKFPQRPKHRQIGGGL
jgi:hypothetical protein